MFQPQSYIKQSKQGCGKMMEQSTGKCQEGHGSSPCVASGSRTVNPVGFIF